MLDFMKKTKKSEKARMELETEVVADLEASDQEIEAIKGGLPTSGASYTRPTKGSAT